MKNEEVQFEEIKVSHTRGGEGRGEGVDANLLSYTLKYSH